MPELQSLYNIDSDRPSVRFYGKNNLDTLRREIVNSRADEIFSIYNHQHFADKLSRTYLKQVLDNTQKFKKLYIAAHKVLDAKLHSFLDHDKFEVRYLPFSRFNCLCEVVIGDKQVFIARQHDSLVIRDNLFSQTLKILFNTMLDIAEKFD